MYRLIELRSQLVNKIFDKVKLKNHPKLELKKLSEATRRAFAKNTTLEITPRL